MDRRKRILRESLPADAESASVATGRSRSRRSSEIEDDAEEPLRRRGAGYSQDVRRACQHRLVQLIPVRRRAYLVTIFVSCLVPALLLLTHYLIYVNGYLNWYGQPLAVLLDASHPRSIAAWLSGQTWLLCLASTILTFQLRRHKLDDYNGDYRLWFWLVSTCVIGSLDSTTRVIDVFGDALNRWSMLNLGWTGPAVVQATLALLIGMLGVRLCSELKTVPTSLVFWLVGLVAWAGSAALGQEMLRIDISIQFRIWLRSALWLGGLTAIWLSALSYLRFVYIEAQRRFLLRGRLAASVSSTWKERISESMPAMPTIPTFLSRRPVEEEAEPVEVNKKSREKAAQVTLQPDANALVAALRRFGLPSFMKRKTADVGDTSHEVSSGIHPQDERTQPREEQRTTSQPNPSVQASQTGNGPLSQTRRTEAAAPSAASRSQSTSAATNASTNKERSAAPQTVEQKTAEQTAAPAARRSWLGRLVSKPNMSVDASEYPNVKKTAKSTGTDGAAPRRGWMPKLSLPKILRVPRLKLPKLSMPKMSLPKLKLPSLRLPPPESNSASDSQVEKKPDARSLPASKPLPTTNGPASQAVENGGRPLSKAERKRLKRLQDDDEYEVEDRRAA